MQGLRGLFGCLGASFSRDFLAGSTNLRFYDVDDTLPAPGFGLVNVRDFSRGVYRFTCALLAGRKAEPMLLDGISDDPAAPYYEAWISGLVGAQHYCRDDLEDTTRQVSVQVYEVARRSFLGETLSLNDRNSFEVTVFGVELRTILQMASHRMIVAGTLQRIDRLWTFALSPLINAPRVLMPLVLSMQGVSCALYCDEERRFGDASYDSMLDKWLTRHAFALGARADCSLLSDLLFWHRLRGTA